MDLTDWPKGGYQNSVYICTKDKPMPEGAPGPWQHTNAYEVGEQEDGWPSGDIVTYECGDCKHRWRSELPQ